MGSSLAFLFPGQGSQEIGMGKDFYFQFESSRRIFDQANEILGWDLKSLIFEGRKEELQKTENAQIALLTTSISTLRVLEEEGVKATAVAGHSLGEFSAYVSSGSLSFESALRLVLQRGKLMAQADPENRGTMAALIGLSEEEVEKICREISSPSEEIVPANLNCPGQIVISGDRNSIKEAIKIAKERGAKMVIMLEVSGAFHSKFVNDSALKFEDYLNQTDFQKPKIPVIANINAQPIIEESDIRDSLKRHMTSPVLWHKSIETMIHMGIDTFIEVGHGKVLQGLMRRIDRNTRTFGTETLANFQRTLEFCQSSEKEEKKET